ncbi:hypothetical protein L3X38_000233 (mitochondrion) [Prunus dulcis]|uniref:Uncharacterized protein n=1 Tax=Prunus dulcis TaxID=3755 RepID=A0AAD4UTG0_PRUDU|nr:hypothetical protein L3X38_000233 [Prunus dulcis]
MEPPSQYVKQPTFQNLRFCGQALQDLNYGVSAAQQTFLCNTISRLVGTVFFSSSPETRALIGSGQSPPRPPRLVGVSNSPDIFSTAISKRRSRVNGTPVRKVFTPKGRSTREQSSLSFPCLNWTKDLENACRENSQVRSLTSTSSYLTLESKQPRPPVCKHLRSPGLRQQGDKLESHTCIGLIFFPFIRQ